MTRMIPLTRGMFTIVDDADYATLQQYKWLALQAGKYTYAARSEVGRWVLMHRLLLNANDDTLVDHINTDTLDNRRGNLRLATQMQNQQNRRGANRTSTTGVRGVAFDRSRCKYRAYLTVRGLHVNLGRFTTLKEAAQAAESGRKTYFTYSKENNDVST